MARFRLGNKPGVGPALKIMASDADDPWTTPNTDYEKFRFNSEVQELSYFREIIKIPVGLTTTYWPAGTDISNYVIAVGGSFDPQVEINRARAIARWGYLPIFLVRPRYGSKYIFKNDIFGRWFGLIAKKMTGDDQFSGFYWRSDTLISRSPGVDVTEQVIVVTAFPATANYSPVTGTPSPGQKTLKIDTATGQVRMAKPGFDVDTATPDQLIFGDNKQPLHIMAYEITSVPWRGVIEIPISSAIPAGSFVDLRPHHSGYPMSLSAPIVPMHFTAWTEPGALYIQDHSPSETYQYAYPWVVSCYVLGDQAPTVSGPNNRILTTQGKFELTRAGSAANPTPGDIIVSSEFRYGTLLNNYGVVNSYSPATDPWWSTFFGGGEGLSKNIIPLPNLANNPIVFTSVEFRGADAQWEIGDLAMDFSLYYSLLGNPPKYYRGSHWFVTTPTGLHLTIAWADSNFYFRYYVISVPN